MTVSALQLKAKELIIPLREGRPIALDLQVSKLREVQVDDYAPLEKTSRRIFNETTCTMHAEVQRRQPFGTGDRRAALSGIPMDVRRVIEN